MTIDLSNLSSEKRAFLKAYPEFLASLEKAIPMQVSKVKTRKEKMSRGKAKWQRDLEDVDRRVEDVRQRAEELRRKYDPELMRIERHFMEHVEKAEDILICPECGDSDHKNKMNGKPWCMKCNTILIPKDKLEKWMKLPKIKGLSLSDILKSELRKLNPGLNPDNKEV